MSDQKNNVDLNSRMQRLSECVILRATPNTWMLAIGTPVIYHEPIPHPLDDVTPEQIRIMNNASFNVKYRPSTFKE